MVVLEAQNISKSYGTDVILKDINLKIEDSEKVGLVGKNGAGKTTLFKILSKQIEPDNGALFISNDKTIGYLSQNIEFEITNNVFEEALKVFENVKNIENRLRELELLISSEKDEQKHSELLNEYGILLDKFDMLDGYSIENQVRRILTGLGIPSSDFTKSVVNLSGGQKTRLSLAKLLLKNPDILLLDEPTNHLDLEAIKFLEEFLKEYRGACIIISHDRYFLDVITTKTFELINGTIEEYNGNYTYFINERQNRLEEKLKHYELQQKEIQRLEEMIERFRSFNREKSIKQAESKEKMLDRIERIEKPQVFQNSVKIKFEIKFQSGNDVISLENIKKSFGDKTLFENLSLFIKRGERVALIGSNGKGKTTLFRIICGLIEPDAGFVRLGKNVLIGYYDQEQSNLSEDKTVIDEVWDEYPNLTTTQIRNYLAAFLFTKDDVFKSISTLSGGEKARLSMLKVMLKKPNLLLLDEPTNHLDILSREALENALMDYEGTIFAISHDRYFLNKIFNKIIEFDGSTFSEFIGNFDYYIQKKNTNSDEIVINTVGKTKTQIKDERRKEREKREQQKAKENEIKDIEKQIESLESKISDLESLLCQPDIYSEPDKVVQITKELNSNKDLLSRLYEKWEELLN
ncbi:putative ABC transporter ATP-binding protein YheS [Caloramator mitchellensis]|uniref:Putative ABC transporter ATP-binding protein YheS n=1 Tax=Caloramator mitchellensis TaxID=908809 RepID=A0A0R3JVN7_CALMK|nr:ABC-F family ATP-binding cassette domain-containing protein [Caloramator mitchellensis]KRQ87657.1 putative ABC transporter ATP-binding protein YheS [Caloramator mitchellensis]